MNEIEKMYENIGIKKQYDYIVIRKKYNGKIRYTKRAVLEKVEQFKNKTLRIIEVCPFYTDFTTEKQIELIKWLCQHTYRNYIKFRFDICGLWHCECNMSNSDMHHTFEDALIDVLMQIWQDLTPEEKQQIKEILE